jgi:hypothetical protein
VRAGALANLSFRKAICRLGDHVVVAVLPDLVVVGEERGGAVDRSDEVAVGFVARAVAAVLAAVVAGQLVEQLVDRVDLGLGLSHGGWVLPCGCGRRVDQ